LESMNPQNSLLFLIGPEGGFRKDEVALATQNGFSSVTLGPRILRAETATIAAMAILQFMTGNLCRSVRSEEEWMKSFKIYPSLKTQVLPLTCSGVMTCSHGFRI
ncbi:MAG: RsmE family RNA methyltransferase, partial [Proteobacteria bacterium]|nr:RsmE family RNA methyltransferase [Pseudomonadota bacterium]MBU1710212.1 RsmE family RNA methyltransferase [Pseudomonadota bacterium]